MAPISNSTFRRRLLLGRGARLPDIRLTHKTREAVQSLSPLVTSAASRFPSRSRETSSRQDTQDIVCQASLESIAVPAPFIYLRPDVSYQDRLRLEWPHLTLDTLSESHCSGRIEQS